MSQVCGLFARYPELHGNPRVGMPDDATLSSPHPDPLADRGTRLKLETGAAQGKIENSAVMHLAVGQHNLRGAPIDLHSPVGPPLIVARGGQTRGDCAALLDAHPPE